MCHFSPKMMDGHNSGSALRICFNFSAIKEANMYIKTILMIFPKKFLFRTIGSFWV